MLSPRAMAVLLAILASSAMAPHTCSAADRCMDTADKLLFKVKSWSELRKWFESYVDCDDGGLAEGVSDYVAASLAQHWHDLPQLKRQIERNPRFEAFVLQHIDATADSDDLAAIVENATKRCPSPSVTLCASLVSAAREALEQTKGSEDSSAQPGGTDEPVSRPIVIQRVEPDTSKLSHVHRKAGVVLLEALVETDGSVSKVRVVKSLHPEIDAVAAEAVRQWRFNPATRKGQPVPAYLVLSINILAN